MVVGNQEPDVGGWRISNKLLASSSFKSTAGHSPFTSYKQ